MWYSLMWCRTDFLPTHAHLLTVDSAPLLKLPPQKKYRPGVKKAEGGDENVKQKRQYQTKLLNKALILKMYIILLKKYLCIVLVKNKIFL